MSESEEKDYTAQFRRDIANGVPAYIVHQYATRYLHDLKELPDSTSDRDVVIAQVENFLKETQTN